MSLSSDTKLGPFYTQMGDPSPRKPIVQGYLSIGTGILLQVFGVGINNISNIGHFVLFDRQYRYWLYALLSDNISNLLVGVSLSVTS